MEIKFISEYNRNGELLSLTATFKWDRPDMEEIFPHINTIVIERVQTNNGKSL